jgi:hypothetical protein
MMIPFQTHAGPPVTGLNAVMGLLTTERSVMIKLETRMHLTLAVLVVKNQSVVIQLLTVPMVKNVMMVTHLTGMVAPLFAQTSVVMESLMQEKSVTWEPKTLTPETVAEPTASFPDVVMEFWTKVKSVILVPATPMHPISAAPTVHSLAAVMVLWTIFTANNVIMVPATLSWRWTAVLLIALPTFAVNQCGTMSLLTLLIFFQRDLVCIITPPTPNQESHPVLSLNGLSSQHQSQ